MNGELITSGISTPFQIHWLTAHGRRRPDVEHLCSKLSGLQVTLFHTTKELGEVAQLVFVELPNQQQPCAILTSIRERSPEALVIVWNPRGSIKEAVELIKLGVFHYMAHSEHLPLDELAHWISAAAQQIAADMASNKAPIQKAEEPWRRFLIGNSPPMEALAATVRLLAVRRSTVLITGETGTGKEVLAKALHLASPRGHLPMVAVNCTALPETLLESELFGHTKGAFTGAVQGRAGRFEQAHKSTIFLDEIGDMPLETQAKLLRVLQEKEIQKLGSSEVQKVDVRVIAATNVDLEAKTKEGKFREDLYYRLNVVPVELPALRHHLEDIPQLVEHFLVKIAAQEEMEPKRIAEQSLEKLMGYHWPGNIRQLENAVDRAITFSGDRKVLLPADFPIAVNVVPGIAVGTVAADLVLSESGIDFESIVSRLERSLIDQALRRSMGNKKKAADILGLKRTTLAAKLKTLEAAAS